MSSILTAPLIRIVALDSVSREDWGRILAFKGWEVKAWVTLTEMLSEDDLRRPGCLITNKAESLLFSSIETGRLHIPVILLQQEASIDAAVEAMKQGVKDYLQQPVDPERLIKAVSPWMQVDRSLEREEIRRFEQNYRSLSSREREVIHLSCQGATHEYVAQRLGIATKTAQVHRYNAYCKLGSHNITEISRWLLMSGFSQSDD